MKGNKNVLNVMHTVYALYCLELLSSMHINVVQRYIYSNPSGIYLLL